MVHTWVSLQNDRIAKPCDNRRVLRIFRVEDTFFYGDYELDIYMGTKHDYKSLDAVLAKVIAKSNGWVRYARPEDAKETSDYGSLFDIINVFGSVGYSERRKLFPWRETGDLVRATVLRKDGNFSMFACETRRFYYVLCFATS